MKLRRELSNLLHEVNIFVEMRVPDVSKEEAWARKGYAFLGKLKDKGITPKTDKGKIFFDEKTTKNLKELVELIKYYDYFDRRKR